MEDAYNLSAIAEEQFDQLAVYFVPDSSTDEPRPAGGASQAELSLPRNLHLKPSQTPNDVSPAFESRIRHIFPSSLLCASIGTASASLSLRLRPHARARSPIGRVLHAFLSRRETREKDNAFFL